MNRLTSRILCAPIVVALVIYTVPVAAQEASTAQREFRIDLEEVLDVEPIDFGVAGWAPEASNEPVRIAALEPIPIRDARRLEQATHAQTNTAKKDGKMKRSFRYMKKHWWIPTLIGVAVAVVLLEPFDDDDDERRRAQQMNP